MSLDERASALIKRIYCAGHDSHEWDSIAAEVLRLTGGSMALTTIVDLSCRHFDTYRLYAPETSDVARGIDEYADKYSEDPSLVWASRHPDARFCDSSKTMPASEYLESDFIRWNRARFGSTHWYVGYSPPDDHVSFSFSVHFPAEQGAGDPKAIRLFRMLFDHMECAVRATRRPFNPESTRSLLLLDSQGCVRQMSIGARALLAGRGPVTVAQGQMRGACAADQGRLDAAIARSANALATGQRPCAIQVSQPHGRPWILVFRPLLSDYGLFHNVRCELLVEIHAGIPPIASLDLVQSLFDLTARELQVVRLLADGHSVESLAESMHISPNTARAFAGRVLQDVDNAAIRTAQALRGPQPRLIPGRAAIAWTQRELIRIDYSSLFTAVIVRL